MKHIRVTLSLLSVLLLCTLGAQAQPAAPLVSTQVGTVPHLVKFTGSVKDASGKPRTGVSGITFALYREDQGGAPLWIETQNVQLDSAGRYSTMLGMSKAEGLPTELFASGEARWLGVQAEGQAEQPRVLLLSVPYALKAADAETIGGLPASAFVRALPADGETPSGKSRSGQVEGVGPLAKAPIVHGAGTIGSVPLWSGASLLGTSLVSQSGGNIGIGTVSPATALDVNGAATIRGNASVTGSISAANGFNLGSNAFASGTYSNGNAFLGFAGNSATTGGGNTGTGYLSLLSNSSGTYNTASGYDSLRWNTTGSTNTATGAFALALNTAGSNNTANGWAALFLNTTGSANAGYGYQALYFNTTGYANTASGYQALYSNTTGYTNAAFGYQALGLNTTGFENTAIGSAVLSLNTTGQDNTAVGVQALGANTAGTANSAVGSYALVANTTGDANTAQGTAALTYNSTGSYNSAFGYNAGPGAGLVNLTNTTAIGAEATVTSSNSMVLGSISGVNNATAGTNVGIGTTAPQARLDVAANGLEVYIGDPQCGGSGTAAIGFGGAGFVNCGNYALRGDSGGNLYFNSSSTGWMFFDHNNKGLMSLDPSGNLSVAGAITAGTKDFKIDHPLDPENKYLYHASVESSEMMNIYTGNVTTNASGDATAELPDWFEALNGDFRYQLTVIGQFAQAIVASEIANRHFAIKTDKPKVKVSWQVTGVRHDAWAAAHRLQVEVEKSGQERGHYLHPELYRPAP